MNHWNRHLLRATLGCATFGLIASAGCVAAPAAPPAATSAVAPSPALYRQMADDIEANLREHVLAQWFPRALEASGGFHETFGADWAKQDDPVKSLIYQSRLTWVAAQAASRFPDESAQWTKYSNHGLDYLLTDFWDETNGGFYHQLDASGKPTIRDGEKHVYGNAFAIYALCANYQVTRNPRALEIAKRAFNWLETSARDPKNGGYIEAIARDGTPLREPNNGRRTDLLGTPWGYKTMNSHIHLLESLTALHEVWPDEKVKTRLAELTRLVGDKIYVEPGALNLYFNPDWRAVPDLDSFGHDVETAYLLSEAAEQLGGGQGIAGRRARRLVDHALEVGWDAENGGFYDAGTALGGPRTDEDKVKVWWAQAEGLNALLLMHRKYGAQTPEYWQAFVAQWDFIRNHMIDETNGGWITRVAVSGEIAPDQRKSDRSKDAYHQGRALLNVSATLRELAGDKAEPVKVAAKAEVAPTKVEAGVDGTIHLEAEEGVLTGVNTVKKRAGYSGSGYVTGFNNKTDQISFAISNAKSGVYNARLRYSAPTGAKRFKMVVNGQGTTNMLRGTADEFADFNAGNVELKNGANLIVIENDWGWYDIDALDLVPAKVDAALPAPPLQLADTNASPNARTLMRYLVGQYGRKTLSGQQNIRDSEKVRQLTGKVPAIVGDDLMEFSPSRNELRPDKTKNGKLSDLDPTIKAARGGQIITMLWHWNAPAGLINNKNHVNEKGKKIDAGWYRGFYADATNFDFEKALDNPDSAEYQMLIRDIDAIAVALKRFADADIPLLWRPLHEAEGGWFWWGAKGPEPLKRLWRLTFDRLTKHHGLHNLIWVFNSVDPDWYPGDETVDIISADAYPEVGDALSGVWENGREDFGDRKLLALSEFGGVPDVDKMRRLGVRWSYWMTWTGDRGLGKMSDAEIKRIYDSPFVLTRDEIDAAAVPYATERGG